tara:strand:- start:919 stop:3132 length:2214 start_codon:yes stop_codon:yes gene_type:complete
MMILKWDTLPYGDQVKYDDIQKVNELLEESKDAESDLRDMVRECHNFLDKRDGQWEPEIIRKMTGRPRYTFDKCNPVVDGIAGEIEGADFGIRVMPSGGSATKPIAKTYDGLIRNIQTMSNASHVYNAASRSVVEAGLGGWEIYTDYIDADSFDQDFIIKWISNYEDRVWFDTAATMQDMSDANHVFILDNITPDDYDERFPDGSKQSIGSNRTWESYEYKPDFITVGRILYKEKMKLELVLMSDGAIYEDNDDFKKIVDDKAAQGITVKDRRKKKGHKVMSRMFDASAFLNEKPQDTVFKDLPIVPMFGNFKVREGKILYRGAIEKLMDAQRTYNYARSREIEDVALSPPAVTWASRVQLGNVSDRKAAEEMSVSAKRVYLFTPDPANPGPPMMGQTPGVSAGIQQAALNSLSDIQTSSARAPLQNGDIEQSLSGVAINALNSRSDTGTIKYFKSREIAQCYTAKVLINAIPNLYDSSSQKRILNEDGSYEMIDLNEMTLDQETGEAVFLNDLSQGKYDVTCEVGDMFANRQQETVKSLNDLSKVVPGLGEMTADIMLQNISAPGVEIAAERVRNRMLQSGAIPQSQYTKEEKEELQRAMAAAQGQEKELTPDEKIAQAEVERVMAETADVQNKGVLKQEELRIKEQKDLMEAQYKADKLDMEELKLMMSQQAQQSKQQQEFIEANIKGQSQVYDALYTQAQTLKLITDSMGASSVIAGQQVAQIDEQQDEITDTL